jgi:hypothetical protein
MSRQRPTRKSQALGALEDAHGRLVRELTALQRFQVRGLVEFAILQLGAVRG